MSAVIRNNVKISGSGDRKMMFAHGYGCDQAMWRFVAPAFEDQFTVVKFDHVGAGGSVSSAFDHTKYATLQGYADDIIEIGREIGLRGAVFVGHSVSAMIGALASIKEPEMFESLVMVCPSPRYVNDAAYVGGFGQTDIEELLGSLAENYLGWSTAMAPVIMANGDRPELSEELTDGFCRMDPKIAETFARATFTSDNRGDLPDVSVRTLVLQCKEDIIAAEQVGRYVADNVQNGHLVILDATGHCPNLSAPNYVISAIGAFV
ncbi:alpha/beta hydrolase [Rhizobium sp. PL01]|uniref:alpha/beta fold hydrolase n=1 Tax=Rhizobium sp. PL01 TaxID=3085631 RepID=UPI002981A3BD|nr:alpha/beta hydrolase [Rhizobium sp. PL01]MDW5318472.1 alpha/beta hydrolase [Rhizobium sp. PL01]